MPDYKLFCELDAPEWSDGEDGTVTVEVVDGKVKLMMTHPEARLSPYTVNSLVVSLGAAYWQVQFGG